MILTALCGHGLLDLPAYDLYIHRGLEDIPLSQEKLEQAFQHLPLRA